MSTLADCVAIEPTVGMASVMINAVLGMIGRG
jgi:hypothetical protein